MTTPHAAMDIPGSHHDNHKHYPPSNNNNHSRGSPPYHLGTSPGSSTSPRSSAGSQQYYPQSPANYPQSPVNYNPGGANHRGSANDSKHGGGGHAQPVQSPQRPGSGGSDKFRPGSGASGGGHRPPSAQSSGYRLAMGIEDSEGYLEPRSSAGSYQLQQQGRIHPREHDSGVDIDQSRDSNHHDNVRTSGSDQSANSGINFSPNGGKEANSHKDMTKNARPESLAYRHEYEELPLKYPNLVTNKDHYAYADVDENAQSNTSAPGNSGGSANGSSSGNLSSQNYRRRQNPLYDAVVREDSKISGKSATTAGCNRCLCVSIILLAILCVLAVILACVAISRLPMDTPDARTVYMVSTPSYAQLQEAYNRISELEIKYQTLQEKYIALHDMIGVIDTTVNMTLQEQLAHQGAQLHELNNATVSNRNTVDRVAIQVEKLQNDSQTMSNLLQNQLSGLTDSVVSQNSTLTDLQENVSELEGTDVAVVMTKLTNHSAQLNGLTSTLTQMEMTFGSFRTEIRGIAQNISKAPGPRGPPGAGNLTACEHKKVSRGTSLGNNAFNTSSVPTDADSQVYVLLGLECSTNTQYHQLVMDGENRYRCMCSGAAHPNPNTNRFCEMHYWRCPRIS